MKILIIVPAYNEEQNIVSVINSLKNENQSWNIVVVNDGSADETGRLSEMTGMAYTVNLPCNLGIGGAVQTGFMFAYRNNYDIAVQVDGDGQHIASEINKLIKPVLNDECDVVIGSRFFTKHDGWKSSFARRIGIKIFEVINSLLISQRITDNTSGFRAYNKRAIEFLSKYYPMDYPEPEAVILLGKNKFKIKEIPAEMKERNLGRSSIFGYKSIYYMIKVLLAELVTFMRAKAI
jgi:glycosyltransferase involved in cell wall biosynthesis